MNTEIRISCNICYTRHGYCKKCFGSGLNFRKDKPCNKCEKGRRIKKRKQTLNQVAAVQKVSLVINTIDLLWHLCFLFRF